MMNQELMRIIQQSENIELKESTFENYTFFYVLGLHGKHYLFCEEADGKLEETMNMVERICTEDGRFKDVYPQYIYTVILKQVKEMDEAIYKEIISVEENEYFCKKYVLYYEEKEFMALKEWIHKEGKDHIEDLLNSDNCALFFDIKDKKEKKIEEEKKKWAVNLLLRIIIKCPFVKCSFRKVSLSNFAEELERKIHRAQRVDEEQMRKYKKDFFDKLQDDNIDQKVDLFIENVRKEME